MKANTATILSLLALAAAGSALDLEDGNGAVGDRVLISAKKAAKLAMKAEKKAKRKEIKRLKRLRRKKNKLNKYGYDDYKGHDDYKGYDDYKGGKGHDDYKGWDDYKGGKGHDDYKGWDDYKGHDYYNGHDDFKGGIGGSECILTACISMFPKDMSNGFHFGSNGWNNRGGFHRRAKSGHSNGNWHPTPAPAPGGGDMSYVDIRGQVTMAFDLYEGHRTHMSPSFYWEFSLRGLPRSTQGRVHLFDEETCSAIRPGDERWGGFYNWALQVTSPWTDQISYHSDSSGRASGLFFINNAWPCQAAIGKTAYVEIPGSDQYGCGKFYPGYADCGGYH